MGEKLFVLYEGRAKYDGTDRAAILVSAQSQKEALADTLSWRGYDAVWYEYDVVNKKLVNEKMRPDIGKGILS